MPLTLPPCFTFTEFKRVTPVDASNVLSVIIERHADHMTVKHLPSAHDNLRKIFEATFRLANRKGFAATTLRDLCKETGLSMGGLYGYFASKDDLASTIEEVVRYLSREIPSWFGALADPHERLDSTLRAHVFVSELLQPWFYFVFMESRLLSPAQRMVARSSELHFQGEIARLVDATGVPKGSSAQLMASHSMALIQDWYIKRWKYRQQKVTVDEFANSVCRFVQPADWARAGRAQSD